MQKQLEEISAIKEDTSHQITLEEALLEDSKREIIQIENTLVDFNKQVYDQDQKIHQLKEQEAVAQTRIHAMNETKHRNVQDINEFQLKLNLSQTDLDANQEKLIALQQNLETLQQNYNEKKQDHEREETDLHKKRLHLERINTELRTLQDELLAQKSEAQEKNYQIKLFQEQFSSIESENIKSGKKIKEISQQLDTFEHKKDEITKESSLKLSKITSLQNSMQQIEQEILNKKEVLQQHTVQIDAIKSRIEFFTQIISNYEGHTLSTRYIMTSKQNFPGLHGPLSDLINVDDDHRGAVEAALGDAINFLVVENIQAAKEIIEQVTKENQGRVTILPLDRLNQISLPHEMPQVHLPLLSTLVDCDPQYDKIFALLLGDVALTDNLDHALEESVKYPNLRYATQNGELVNAQSIITAGGKPDSPATLIGRREKLERLNQDLKDLENTFYLTISELEKLVDKKKSEQQGLQQYEDDNNTSNP
jgi:chromosome segregation protein